MRGLIAFGCLTSLLVLVVPQRARAEDTFTVGNGTAASCTESALENALAGAAAAGGGKVRFRCGGGAVTISVTETLIVPHNTTIDGAGLITLDGVASVMLLFVGEGSTVALKSLTITNAGDEHAAVANQGTLTVHHGTFTENNGGAIDNEGSLTISNSTFRDNGGGAFPAPAGTIHNHGTLSLSNSIVSGHFGLFAGALSNGGIATVVNTTFSMNLNLTSSGGAITNGGTLTVRNSEIVDNFGDTGGGGITSGGTLTVINTLFARNLANLSLGGGIQAFGATTIRHSTFSHNRAAGGAGMHLLGGDATISHSTFEGNTSLLSGGGLLIDWSATVAIDKSLVTQNTAGPHGGGIENVGTLLLRNSDITRNSSGQEGGGVYTCCGGTTAFQKTVVIGNTPDNIAP